jgi:prevent-host-death family protein
VVAIPEEILYNVTTNVTTWGLEMETIGVRGLKMHASEILKRVREEGATYHITHRGRVVARLVPVGDPDTTMPPFSSAEELLAAFDALADEIGQHVPPGTTVQDIMDDIRRDP